MSLLLLLSLLILIVARAHLLRRCGDGGVLHVRLDGLGEAHNGPTRHRLRRYAEAEAAERGVVPMRPQEHAHAVQALGGRARLAGACKERGGEEAWERGRVTHERKGATTEASALTCSSNSWQSAASAGVSLGVSEAPCALFPPPLSPHRVGSRAELGVTVAEEAQAEQQQREKALPQR